MKCSVAKWTQEKEVWTQLKNDTHMFNCGRCALTIGARVRMSIILRLATEQARELAACHGEDAHVRRRVATFTTIDSGDARGGASNSGGG